MIALAIAIAALLAAGPPVEIVAPVAPAPRRQTERRVEREVPPPLADAALFRIVHGFGECRVLVAEGREKPRAVVDFVASGPGSDAERRYVELCDLSIAEEPAAGTESPRIATVRSLFPPKEQQPAGLSFAARLTI